VRFCFPQALQFVPDFRQGQVQIRTAAMRSAIGKRRPSSGVNDRR
jgi:hypothetical protein